MNPAHAARLSHAGKHLPNPPELTDVELKESKELSALQRIKYWTLFESTYVVMLAAGHARLVAVGSELVEVVLVGEEDMVIEGAIGVVTGVAMIVGVMVDLRLVVLTGNVDKVLLVSGQVAPGLQGSIEQQPLNPFWQT